MPRKSGLKLFLKTWPLKNKSNNCDEDKSEDKQRPLTATLEKPTILDIRYLRTIDMSLIRKEFLSITNLCRFPLVIQTSKADINSKESSIIIKRPLSLPPPRLNRNKTKKNSKKDRMVTTNVKLKNSSIANDDCISDLDVSITTNTSGENERNSTSNKNKICSAKSKLPKKISFDDHNNNQTKTNKTLNNHKIANKSLKVKQLLQPTENAIQSSLSQEKTVSVPEPCRTCGRSDQPERFHSHPTSSFKRKNIKMENNLDSNRISIVKSTVQKPVAIKYQSKVKNVPRNAIFKSPLPAQKLVHTPPSGPLISSQQKSEDALSTIHNLNQVNKFNNENNLTESDWNDCKISQSLTPCLNCGRTFLPDRLLVHQRSCKTTTIDMSGNKKNIPTRKTFNENSSKGENTQLSNELTPIRSPLSEKCQICGKQFGKHSIKIHERQCLKKWQMENDHNSKSSSSKTQSMDKPSIGKNANNRQISPPRTAHLVPCYICGRLFTLVSIKIHEPQCLKKWRLENDKLPPEKQRKEPTKPILSYKEDGTLDLDQMIEDSWQEHLNQLVPCSICGRTFNPDRVDIHQRNCKGKGF